MQQMFVRNTVSENGQFCLCILRQLIGDRFCFYVAAYPPDPGGLEGGLPGDKCESFSLADPPNELGAVIARLGDHGVE